MFCNENPKCISKLKSPYFCYSIQPIDVAYVSSSTCIESHFDPTIRDARCRFRKVVLDGCKRFAFSKSWHLTNHDNHDDFGVSLNFK